MRERFVAPKIVGERGVAMRQWTTETREHFRTVHAQGTSATQVARGLADAMEEALAALFERAQAAASVPVALVALGSLGRRELSPYSDLDLIVISEHPKSDDVRVVADEFFYPLWDARMEVGHAVRSPDDFARLALEDETVRTGAVDYRPLAGDPALIKTLGQRLQQALSSSATKKYASQAVQEWTQGATPATVYHLQPDIKTGPGGLREIHRLWWLGRLLWKIEAWHDYLSLGLIDRHGLETLSRGREELLNIRMAMHFVAGRRQDLLRFDLQDEVAAYLKIPDGPGQRLGGDNLLEMFYRHAKDVRMVASRVLERCAENLTPYKRRPAVRDAEGFDMFQGALTLRRVEQFESSPIEILRIFRVAQRMGVRLYVHARARVAEAAPRLIDESVRRDPQAARLFLDMLADPQDQGETLEWLHGLGVLEKMMPEFEVVTGLAQRDLYHVHTVDAHSVSCARAALKVLAGGDSDTPDDIRELGARVARPHVFVLSCLLHDIGKGHGHGHAERGAVMARTACERLYMREEDVADVEFLVLEHLTMFKLSQRRDLEDKELVARFAETVGTQERLDLLMLLSYCDALTTGPEAWTAWKAQLLRDLYTRARASLRGGINPDTLAAQSAKKLADVISIAPEDADAMRALAARLVPRHLVTHRIRLLVRHLHAVQAAGTGAHASAAKDQRDSQWEIVVVGPDRPGLVSDLAGVFAAWGVSVDAAHISGTIDNVAIDTFTIRHGASSLFEKERRLQAMLVELRCAVTEPVDYGPRIQERRKAESMRLSGVLRAETRILYDLDAQSDATVVDVFAPDRVAFLHDVTRAIFQAGASIVLARINTEGERAVDAFYLVDAKTGKPLNPDQRQVVEQAIRQAASLT